MRGSMGGTSRGGPSTVAAWCSDCHQTTEKCTTGTTAKPATPSHAARRALTASAPRWATYTRSISAVDTSRGSQAHQTPHTPCPHTLPDASATAVLTTPTSDDACDQRSQRARCPGCLARSRFTLAASTPAKARYAVHAAGTCTYISRCHCPCTASSGAATAATTADATMTAATAISWYRAAEAAGRRTAAGRCGVHGSS